MSCRSYKSWAYHVLEKFRSLNPDRRRYHYHGNRHNFAHKQYEKEWIERTGVKISAPVLTGNFGKGHLKEITKKAGLTMHQARIAVKGIYLTIAEKLGHHRAESSFAYIGMGPGRG